MRKDLNKIQILLLNQKGVDLALVNEGICYKPT